MLKDAYSFRFRSIATFLGVLPGIGSKGSITLGSMDFSSYAPPNRASMRALLPENAMFFVMILEFKREVFAGRRSKLAVLVILPFKVD